MFHCFIADVCQPWTDSRNYYFEYLIIHFDQIFVSITHIIRLRFVGSNISKHICISLLVFCWILKIVAGVVFSTIFLPRESGFRTFFVPGDGDFALSKQFPRGLPGGDGHAWN